MNPRMRQQLFYASVHRCKPSLSRSQKAEAVKTDFKGMNMKDSKKNKAIIKQTSGLFSRTFAEFMHLVSKFSLFPSTCALHHPSGNMGKPSNTAYTGHTAI